MIYYITGALVGFYILQLIRYGILKEKLIDAETKLKEEKLFRELAEQDVESLRGDCERMLWDRQKAEELLEAYLKQYKNP